MHGHNSHGGGTEAQAVGFSIGDKGYIGTGQNMNNEFWEFTPDSVCVLSFTSASAIDSTLCEKFCTDFFDQSTNNPVSWQWIFEGGSPPTSDAQNPTNICYNGSGSYNVTLITTDAGGNSDTLLLADFITVFSTPSIPTIAQNGDTLVCSNASSYQWQYNVVNIPGATNQSYIATQSGFYTVIVGDENGCVNSATIEIDLTGINDPANESFISIYPNPSDGIFTVALSHPIPSPFISLEIINSLGEKILSSWEMNAASPFKKELNLNGIAPGIYFVKMRTSLEYLTTTMVITK
jgi:hypothetical protein